ncbi:MAG TPA: sulfur starvation response protein OscA [Pseudomonas sp.]|jgi:hypothetical protein|uniref:sulfur starvation response protein OscA n=1 Tax=Pseudomonas sp. TaxID=306 RepID=UPI002B81EFA4|nr:sulfur starvation response protein OscA [Pseudomonas sp.]HTO19878.1 sulfur starvation response protein OscA [Pseudomonas sp.]
MSTTPRSLDVPADDASLLREIHAALRNLRYGSVEITVHDSRVVQIERKEKYRLSEPRK